jgi:hypothetical protein
VLRSSTIQITELPSSPVNTATIRIRSSVPAIPTPEQPQPTRVSSRIQAEGRAQVNILEKAVQSTKEKNLEGNDTVNANSFSVLHDDVILDKALEIGIDVASIPLTTIHLLKDLDSARDNLANKKFIKNVVSKVVEIENVNSGEEDNGLSGVDDNFDEFTDTSQMYV